MFRFGVPHGRTPAPVVTLHSTGDGGAVPDQEQWYAEQVRRSGDPSRLRQLYVDRGMHCSFSAAEEIVTLRTLFERMDSGRWPHTSPRRLSQAAHDLGAGYQLVLDFGTFQDAANGAGVHQVHASPVPTSVTLVVRSPADQGPVGIRSSVGMAPTAAGAHPASSGATSPKATDQDSFALSWPRTSPFGYFLVWTFT
jgi:hypothetical protein